MSDNFDYNYQYPELYKTVDPEVDKCIDRHLNDRPNYYMPDQQEIDNMVREVYREVIKKYPEINNDPYENNKRMRVKNTRKYYGRRRIINDFIWFIILERLLRRRRRRPYRPYPAPYRPPYDRYYY